MTNIEMTKLCAEAITLTVRAFRGNSVHHYWRIEPSCEENYDPLHNDEQARALVKLLDIVIERENDRILFGVTLFMHRGKRRPTTTVRNADDLNRAIVKCVAMMQLDRTAPETSTRSADE